MAIATERQFVYYLFICKPFEGGAKSKPFVIVVPNIVFDAHSKLPIGVH